MKDDCYEMAMENIIYHFGAKVFPFFFLKKIKPLFTNKKEKVHL
jgi:hypothetical protein